MEQSEDQSSEDQTTDQDSAPFRAMIARAEAAEASLATFEKEAAEAKAVAQQQRTDAAEVIVKSLDVPNLLNDVLGWVDGEITEESVTAALKAKGLNLVGSADPEPQPEESVSGDDTKSASKLGQAVADAAQGGATKDIGQRLTSADSAADVINIMRETDGSVSYT